MKFCINCNQENPNSFCYQYHTVVDREAPATEGEIAASLPDETFLQQLRRLSVERAINGFKTYDNQPITYWTTAISGEFGELCNMIKKMKRAENGGHDSGHSYTAKSITPKMLREEIGGTLIYIDLLCSFLNIDLEEAIIETFNEKSEELGFPYLLNRQAQLPAPAMDAVVFADWIKDGWIVGISGLWRNAGNVYELKTTEQLYQQFLQSQTKGEIKP